jgi:hypothetical protein
MPDDEDQPEKRTGAEKPVSLAPLSVDDALTGLPATKPEGPPEIVDAARQEAETPADETGEG